MSIDALFQEPDVHQRARAFLRRVFVSLMVVAIVVPAVTGTIAERERIAADELRYQQYRETGLTETALLAIAPANALPDLLRAARYDAMVITLSGEVKQVTLHDETSDVSWPSWRAAVRQKSVSGIRTYETTDPSGGRWIHHRVEMPDGARLITSRPAPLPTPTSAATLWPWVLGAAATLTALGAAWMLLERRVAIPASLLLRAAEDLRVRGEIRPMVRRDIAAIAGVPAEFPRIGTMLRNIEAQSQQGFAQAEELLRAANVLGGSLDPETVLTAALEPLQRLLGNDRSAILRYDAWADRFEVVAARGHDRDWLVDMSMSPVSDMPASIRSIREGIPIQISDTDSEVVSPKLRQRARRHGYRSILAVPLTGELDRPTTMLLQSASPRGYSFDEIELSKSFGAIASAALRNAELFSKTDAELRSQTDRLEAIVESVEQGLLVAASDGRLLYANTTMRMLAPSGGDVFDSQDRYLDEVLARSNAQPNVRSELHGLEPGDQWIDIQVTPVGSTSPRTFRVRKFVVRDAEGAPIGQGQTWTDVSSELELAMMKSGLLATVSHEFRTPLALIKGYATTLLAEDVEWNEADQREFLQLVSGEADRLTELVQRILDMRRIDAGMVELQLMPTQVATVLAAACECIGEAKRRLIVSELPSTLIEVDAARVSTVLRNLISNACKYSPADQPVLISANETSDELVVAVRDFGPGIDDSSVHRIFDTFVRGQSGLAAEQSGLGLGLAIAKGFVEAHNGRIWIEQSHDGPGVSFCFALPLPDDAAADLVTTS